jgi:signal transduction histidine kinase
MSDLPPAPPPPPPPHGQGGVPSSEMAPSVGYARMSGCVLVADPEGRVVSAHSGTRALLGLRPEDTEGRMVQELLHSLDGEDFTDVLHEAAIGRVVERNARTDHAGHIAVWFVRYSSNPPRVAVLGRDLSVINELLLTVEEKQQLSILGQTSVSVARDVRELLAAIRGSAAALADPMLVHAEREHLVTRLATEVGRAGDAVDRLLEVAGAWEDLDERFELRDVADEVLALKRGLLHQEGIRLEEAGVAVPTWVLARRRSTRTAVSTLLGNAIHALSRNPAQRPRRLRISYEVLGSRYVSMAVEDTAGGLPKAIQEEVFERENPHGVYALGLLQARSIAREARGALLLDNHPGEGARFTLLLPRSP